MSQKIQLKRTATPGKIPATTDIDLGEIGINTYDGKLYIKKNNGTESIVEVSNPALTSGNITTALGYIPVNQAGDTMSGDLTINARLTTTGLTFLGTTRVVNSLTLFGTGTRIRGDMSSSTITDRMCLQTTVTNNATAATILPHGSSTLAALQIYSSSTPDTSASCMNMLISGNNGMLYMDKTGSGSYGSYSIYTGGSERFKIDTSGNVTLPTLGARLAGDFSNGTVSNRLMIQTSTVNSFSTVGIIPSGTGTNASTCAYGASDPANAPFIQIKSDSANAVTSINSSANGTGTVLPIVMYTGGVEKFKIDTANGVLVNGGTASVYDTNTGSNVVGAYPFRVKSTSTNSSTAIVGENNATALFGGTWKNTAGKDIVMGLLRIGTFSGTAGAEAGYVDLLAKPSAGNTYLSNYGVRLDYNGNFYPMQDNFSSSGWSGGRWSVVYAASGSINTSDRNEKEQIADLNTAELAVAVRLKGLIKKFKFKDAVLAKGADARIHVGVIAQDVQDAFTAEGLDATDYAVFCSDTWYEAGVITQDMEGNDIITVQEVAANYPNAVQRTRLGVRYDELFAFIIATL